VIEVLHTTNVTDQYDRGDWQLVYTIYVGEERID
jgi:hypothetical protein